MDDRIELWRDASGPTQLRATPPTALSGCDLPPTHETCWSRFCNRWTRSTRTTRFIDQDGEIVVLDWYDHSDLEDPHGSSIRPESRCSIW